MSRSIRIAGDGAIAISGVGEGKLFPVVILDTLGHPDIADYPRFQSTCGPGDVLSTWGKPPNRDDVIRLWLQVKRPIELDFAIAFELQKGHALLIQNILQSGGFYLQAGAEGDSVKATIDEPKVIIDVPETGFRSEWERICLKYYAKAARTEGSNRRDAKELAQQRYSHLQAMASMRPFPK